jgi:hypothetical protein
VRASGDLRVALFLTLLSLSCHRARPPDDASDAGPPKCPLVGTGSSCNTLSSAGQTVEVSHVTTSAPAATGEAPPSGLYALVESAVHGKGTPSSQTAKETENFTMILKGSGAAREMQLVQLRPECPVSRENVAVRFEGNLVKSSLTCPPCPSSSCDTEQTFAWDGTLLRVMKEAGRETAVLTFRRLGDAP